MNAKISARVAMIRCLAGTTWGASATTLRISTQALVFSAAEYCAPAWCRSRHTSIIDATLHEALRTISGCLRATPVSLLPTLAGIAPPALRRDSVTLALSSKALQSESHLLHGVVTVPPEPQRLKSRHPFSVHAHQLLNETKYGKSRDMWLKDAWNKWWKASTPTRLHQFVVNPDQQVLGSDLPRKQWSTLNRLRTGVGRFGSTMKKWGLKETGHCECGHPDQTADHVINHCPKHRPPTGLQGLITLDSPTRTWLGTSELVL